MDFGSYLRTAREKRRLTLDAVSDLTKIKRELLADLEENDLSRWPKASVYRLGYVRSYAQVVGLDPADVLERFEDEFPDDHPVAFHKRRRRGKPKPVTFGRLRQGILAVSLAVVVGAAVAVWRAGNVEDLRLPAPDSGPEARSSQSDADPEIVARAPEPTNAPPHVEDEPLTIEGELRIVSAPPRANVTVNGIGRGQTPIRVRYLPLGSYRIRVVSDGYRARETSVTLKPEQPTRTVRVALRNTSAVARMSYSSTRD